jgi:hypothetical protein
MVAIWGAWSETTAWLARRELYACWKRELEIWSEGREMWKPLHYQTMDVVRRHRRTLLPFLAASLESRDDALRERICQILNYVPFLRWRPEASPDWASTALGCLVELGPEAKPVVPILEKMLYRPGASYNAAQALVAIGPEALQCFERSLASPRPEVRLIVLEGLGSCEEPWRADALPLVLRALDDPDIRVQTAAAGLVGCFPEVREQVTQRLTALLETYPEPGTAAGPALGLALFGGKALDPLLRIYVDNTNRGVRCAAYGALLVAVERPRWESKPGVTFNQLRSRMNLKTLAMAWALYAGTESQASDDLFRRLLAYPEVGVSNGAAALLKEVDEGR